MRITFVNSPGGGNGRNKTGKVKIMHNFDDVY